MTPILAFGYVLSSILVVLAWTVARRDPEHRPVAYLLTCGLASDLARRLLHFAVLASAHAHFDPEPFTGWYRVAAHLDLAIFLAWPATLAAAAIEVFTKRRPWPLAALWAVAAIVLSALYPTVRGPLLQRCYLGAELAAVAVAIGCTVTWGWRHEWPVLRHRAVFFVVAAECAALVGPWRLGPFTRWDVAQLMYTTLYALLVVIHGGSLWKRMSPSS